MNNNDCIKEMISQFLNTEEDKIAFSLYDGETITDISYPRFAQDILKTSAYFLNNGIQNQNIALVAPNSYAWLVTFFSIIATGNVSVLINQNLPYELQQQQFVQANVRFACTETLPKDCVNSNLKWATFHEMMSSEMITLNSIYHHQPEDTIIMLCTSGTTGKSKIVEISSENLQYSIKSYQSDDMESGMERKLMVLPLYHIGGVVDVLLGLTTGRTACIGRGMRSVFLDLPILKPTYVALVPSMMESLEKMHKNSNNEERIKKLGGSLQKICIAGAAPKLSTCRYLIDQGFALVTGYGMTESTGVGTWAELSIDTIRSIGKVCNYMNCQIKDGEILLKGKMVMKGYYNDPEETAKVIEDGWLHTGDMGYCDDDGYYYITGRKKIVIILANGENVNPEEIEAVFGDCEAIEECLVYSDGKGICADVFAAAQDEAAAFIKTYNSKMPKYRQVYKVNYTAEPLPKTSSGKIKRKENQ